MEKGKKNNDILEIQSKNSEEIIDYSKENSRNGSFRRNKREKMILILYLLIVKNLILIKLMKIIIMMEMKMNINLILIKEKEGMEIRIF